MANRGWPSNKTAIKPKLDSGCKALLLSGIFQKREKRIQSCTLGQFGHSIRIEPRLSHATFSHGFATKNNEISAARQAAAVGTNPWEDVELEAEFGDSCIRWLSKGCKSSYDIVSESSSSWSKRPSSPLLRENGTGRIRRYKLKIIVRSNINDI